MWTLTNSTNLEELKERLQNSWFKRLILIGECLLALAGAFAQSNTLQGTIGYDYGYLKDLNFSPLHYEEQGKTYTLGYNWQDASSLNQFSFLVDYGIGQLHTDASETFTTDYIRGNFSLGYLRRFNLAGVKVTDWAIGARYHFYLYYLDWNEQDAFSFFGNHSLDFSASFSHRIQNRHLFSTQLHVPLWSLIVRPPYNGTDPELEYNNENDPVRLITDGVGGSFERLLAFQIDASYQYKINRRWDLLVRYQARYQNLKGQNQLIHLQHQLSTGLQLKL